MKKKRFEHLKFKASIVVLSLIGVLTLSSFKGAEPNTNTTPQNPENKSRYDDPTKYYTLNKSQIKEATDYILFPKSRKYSYQNGKVIGMKITETETLVDIAIRPTWDVYWWRMSENTYLVDRKTNTRYKIRGIVGGMPLGEKLIIKGYNRRNLYFTLIFPPLDKNVKNVDFIELCPTTPSIINGIGFYHKNLKIKKLVKIRLDDIATIEQSLICR